MTTPPYFAAHSDVGRERAENQDAYGFKVLEDYAFYVVCDGMGGHLGGSTAARLAIATIEEKVESLSSLDVPSRLKVALEEANTAIHARAQRQRELRNMGTTAVGIAVDLKNGKYWCAHVGDSRAYLLRGTTFTQLTKDHTMVQRLIDDGILSPEAAVNHPNSNVISRSLGGRDSVEVEIEAEPRALQDGDIFLLCSDGLHGHVTDAVMAEVITNHPPDEAAKILIDLANADGGPDNITVELVVWGKHPGRLHGPVQVVKPAHGRREPRENHAQPGLSHPPETTQDSAPPAPPADPTPVEAQPAVPTTLQYQDEYLGEPSSANGKRVVIAFLVLVVLTAALFISLAARHMKDAPPSERGSTNGYR